MPILFAACALGCACALSLFALQRASGRRDSSAWVTFCVQLGLTAWVLVPAYRGRGMFTVAVAAIALLGARELLATLRSPAALALCLSLLVAGAAALLSTQARDPRHLYFLYGCVELNDSFAFIVGRSLGRVSMFPALSPGKTRVGFAAGLVASACTGAVLGFLEPQWSRGVCAGLGLALGVAGSLADLAASFVKRRAGVKDFSSLLPGHGGVLDAYDSLLLVAPLFYALLFFET